MKAINTNSAKRFRKATWSKIEMHRDWLECRIYLSLLISACDGEQHQENLPDLFGKMGTLVLGPMHCECRISVAFPTYLPFGVGIARPLPTKAPDFCIFAYHMFAGTGLASGRAFRCDGMSTGSRALRCHDAHPFWSTSGIPGLSAPSCQVSRFIFRCFLVMRG